MGPAIDHDGPARSDAHRYVAAMGIELVPLCTIHLTMGEQLFVGEGPAGLRVVVEAAGGTVEGERLSGRIRAGSTADWLTVVGTVGTVDVRATVETDDGSLVLVTYRGRTDLTDGPGAAPIYMAPTFETGAPHLAWLNLVQAVGKGTLVGDDITYEVHEVR